VTLRTALLSCRAAGLLKGPVVQIFDEPRETYTQNLMAARLHPDPEIQAERRCARLERVESIV